MDVPSSTKLRAKLEAITARMNEPQVIRDARRMKALAAEATATRQLLMIIERLAAITREYAEAETLVATAEPDLVTLAKEDLKRLQAEEKKLMVALDELLVPADPRDARDIILELRAGAGGEEAALFAAELFRAYTRLAERLGYAVHVVQTQRSEQGGFKEVVAEINGNQAFGMFKYERGVQRVQRVPSTEKMGRIHTSTVTVAVLPQAEEVDLIIRPQDLRVDTYRASGAGGQHVNKTSSAVRLTHLPTNTVVAVQDERSQHKNRAKALKLLRARLLAAREEAHHALQAHERQAQIGTGDRSEKIRTYNFPQDRVTDHRLKQSWPNLPAILGGELVPMITAAKTAERVKRRQAINRPSAA